MIHTKCGTSLFQDCADYYCPKCAVWVEDDELAPGQSLYMGTSEGVAGETDNDKYPTKKEGGMAESKPRWLKAMDFIEKHRVLLGTITGTSVLVLGFILNDHEVAGIGAGINVGVAIF